ncbi:MAG: hypothetical protein AAFY10_05800 [Pseudomonadota bacterium]
MIRKHALHALVAAACLALAACATSTPYQRDDAGYGYSDRALSEARYEVSFRGNAATSEEDTQTFVLYRAAEIARDKGAPAFRVLGETVETVDVERPFSCYSPYYMTHMAGSATVTEEETKAVASIELLSAVPDDLPGGVFLTENILSDLASCVG